MKESTIHLVYQREYYDDEDMDYFFINYTIFRNLPLSQLKRLNDKNFKQKVKEFCDKNFVETASNYNNYSEVNMIHGSEYYKTYADEFGKSGHYDDNTFYTDYGQKYNTREFFKHDFNEEVTKFMGGII
tara:strand:- start:686 stop:1072 length:387 start_codon:yes stop_codon:yes gene_type:complete